MKKPAVADLKDHIPKDAVSMAAAEAAKSEKKSGEMPRKTHVFSNEDVAYIDALSLELGRKKGKNVSASEALRTIISYHREAHR